MPPFPSPVLTYHDNTYPSISPSRPELSAKGKAVVVTGGGTGIGAETARHFAEAGATRIALLGRRKQPLLDTKASIEEKFPGIEVSAVPTDITDKAQVDAAFSKFADKGKIDVLISNAAVAGPLGGIVDSDADEIIQSIHQNIAGATYVSQAFLRDAAKDAVVVNVSSAAMHTNFGHFTAAYSVSKQAVFRSWDFVGFCNPDMGVFHIQPGIVDTDLNRDFGGVEAFGFEDHASLPASFSLWLASPEARFLKGKFLWANWDVDELKARAEELEKSQELNVGLVGWPFGKLNWLDDFANVKNKAPAK